MSTDVTTKRRANRKSVGGHYRDIGCDDFRKAAENRLRVRRGYCNEWWEQMEAQRDATPNGRPFPKDVPIGQVPNISHSEYQERRKDYVEVLD